MFIDVLMLNLAIEFRCKLIMCKPFICSACVSIQASLGNEWRYICELVASCAAALCLEALFYADKVL